MEQGKPLGPSDMPRQRGHLGLAGVARLAMAWSDLLTVTDGKRTLAAGKPVSCGKGCAACCRQLIPISPAEAFCVAELLDSLPAAARAARRERFRRVKEALAAARPGDPEAYFRLQLDCPFLEEEACTHHALRPLACREHLATSPAEACGTFPNPSIRILSLGHRVGEALSLVCADLLGRPPERIPLFLAPEWVRAHAGEGLRRWDAERVAETLAHRVFSR